MTRVTIIWFVGAAVVGGVAGVLHVLRSDLGGAHTGVALAVGAWAATLVAALMLYHGIVVAAAEQDEAADLQRRPERRPNPDAPAYVPEPPARMPVDGWPVDGRRVDERPVDERPVDERPVDEAYTFRRGRQVGGRPREGRRR